ncbi:hypothetical protein SAMN04487936_111125 [Halobacillus dabanensis]|uniref:Uncharacterized protein n=1 Tax=Halobacillus dabanensis TaxID=240302 RepID=A0A1I3YQJ6_HALDA|nr:hypothetical protein [Halobacillus dabanensis]SFK34128.1 hypothetical protein SAMN04487936_111125 [Halobacillus dabanensis]
MVIALLIMGVTVLLLSFFLAPFGTANALMVAAVLFVSAIVFSLVKSKKSIK